MKNTMTFGLGMTGVARLRGCTLRGGYLPIDASTAPIGVDLLTSAYAPDGSKR